MSIYQNKCKRIDSLALFNVGFSIPITMDSFLFRWLLFLAAAMIWEASIEDT